MSGSRGPKSVPRPVLASRDLAPRDLAPRLAPHFLYLLLKNTKNSFLSNFIVSYRNKPEKNAKSGKFRPCEVYVTALIYKNEKKKSSPIIQFFKNQFLKGDA